jgi:hypothetical protein
MCSMVAEAELLEVRCGFADWAGALGTSEPVSLNQGIVTLS